MVRTPKLIPTLKAEGYELLMHNRPSDNYDVMKDNKFIGRIKVHPKCVKAYTGTEIIYVPYDFDIEVIDCSVEMPIDLFKKMIAVTVFVE